MGGFLILTIASGLSIGSAKVATSLFALALGAGPVEMGAIAAAQSLGLLLISVPVGMLVERAGPRRLFMAGSVLGGLVYLAVPLVWGPWLLAACTALAGFAMPFRFVSLNTVFLSHLVRWGDGRAGWFRGTHMLGVFLLGPAVGGALVAGQGFTVTWWMIAAAYFIAIPLAAWGLGPAGDAAGEGTGRAPAVPSASVWLRLHLFFAPPGMKGAAAVDLIAQGTLMHFTAFSVPLAITVHAIPEQTAVWLVTVQGGFFVAALFLLGEATRRAGPRASLAAAALTAAAGEVLASNAAPAGLWAGAVLLGLGLGGLQVVNLARFARLSATAGRGRVAGLLALTAPVGGILGAVAGGVGGEALGLSATFLLLVPPLLAVAALALREPTHTNPT